jgi:dTDP-4-dehydrorhamnose reductase
MKVLLIGASGQLGSDILTTWTADAVTPVTHAGLDVTNGSAVLDAVREVRPDVVVNTAAFHRVDICEIESARAFAVNAEGALNVARAAAAAGAAVVFVSTDYVFDGLTCAPYTEKCTARPRNVYGASKLAGEGLVAQANARHYIVRTSGLFGVAGASGKGGNFVETMIRLAREGKPIRVVADEALAQTSTLDLAVALRSLVESEMYGTYHVANEGGLSWFHFARMIFQALGLEPDLSPTSSREFGAKAVRPPYSVLASSRLGGLGIRMPRIDDALARYLVAKGHTVRANRARDCVAA